MNKVLKRSMFSMPKHEHKSTGIASGLEYRPGYRVGGRVGFDAGGPVPHPHPHVEEMQNPNPNAFMGSGIALAQQQAKEAMAGMSTPDFESAKIDYTDPSLQMDYSGYMPSRLGAVGSAAGETVGRPHEMHESQWATFIANLSRTSKDYQETRRELDMLQEAQEKEAITKGMEQDQQFELQKMQTDQTLELAKTELVSKFYELNLESADRRAKIFADSQNKDRTFNIEVTMDLIKSITQSGQGFSKMTPERQNEVINYNQLNNITGNAFTDYINAFNKKWIEEAGIDPENPVLNTTQYEQKRQALVQNMELDFGGYGLDFNLIFPPAEVPEETLNLMSDLEAFMPQTMEDPLVKEKIQELVKLDDIWFKRLNAALAKKQAGVQFLNNMPIDEAIQDAITQIEMTHPELKEKIKLNIGG
jgi:hypothetical protein